MATAIVSPSARAMPSTTAPIRPAPTQGSVTLRAVSASDMPSAVAPSRGRIGTPRIRSREVEAMIGITMTASTRPETSRPWPCPTCPQEENGIGIFARTGAMYVAMNGPKVSTPHRPITTLGMPASSSRKPPDTLASRRGSRSTMTSAAPIDTGTAMISAMSRGDQRAEDLRQRAVMLARDVRDAVAR